jgi:hypothetical protein
MFSLLFSFLGGSAFRMIWGEISHMLTARQEQAHEVERLRLQGELDAAQHARNLESIRVQAELGVKTIQVQAEADLGRVDAQGFYDAVRDLNKPSGLWFVDGWNGIVRPATATVVLWLWILALYRSGWVMAEWDKELAGAVLGFFFASRELTKRGK